MSYFPRGGEYGRPYTDNMAYLRASYGALSPLDRISSLRDPYGMMPPGRYGYPPMDHGRRMDFHPKIDNFVSEARNASGNQPVYENRNVQRRAAGGRPFQQSPQKKNVPMSKDLRDTAPKQVLKRPAPKSKAPDQQSLGELLKKMGSDEPVIGLKYITENITEYADSDKTVYSYTCSLCTSASVTADKMCDHITSKSHRKKYIKENKLEEVADKDLAKRAAAIELVHGRGEWAVERKTEGLKLFDKSKLFKKVKKTGDVDMIDLADDKSGDGIKDNDVEVIPGDEADPDVDPKYFVLRKIDEMLDEEEFVIENEEMAMVVDSIIRKLDRALLQFVDIANAGTGVADIGLGDKDEQENMEESATESASKDVSETAVTSDAPVANEAPVVQATVETPAPAAGPAADAPTS